MSKFNPADLTQNIPQDVQEAEAAQGFQDYLDSVKKDPDQAGAQATLTLSIASTIALNIHQAFSRMMMEDRNKKGMIHQLIGASVSPDVAISAGMLAFATVMTRKVQASMMRDANKIADPLARIAAAAHTNRYGDMALNIAQIIEKEVSEGIDAILKADDDGGHNVTTRSGSGALHAFRRQKPDDKPH